MKTCHITEVGGAMYSKAIRIVFKSGVVVAANTKEIVCRYQLMIIEGNPSDDNSEKSRISSPIMALTTQKCPPGTRKIVPKATSSSLCGWQSQDLVRTGERSGLPWADCWWFQSFLSILLGAVVAFSSSTADIASTSWKLDNSTAFRSHVVWKAASDRALCCVISYNTVHVWGYVSYVLIPLMDIPNHESLTHLSKRNNIAWIINKDCDTNKYFRKQTLKVPARHFLVGRFVDETTTKPYRRPKGGQE